MILHLIEEEAERLTSHPYMQQDLRLLLHVLRRADGEGVARFAEGELSMLMRAPVKRLESRNPIPFSASGLRRLIAVGGRAGVYASGSTEREIVLTFAYREQEHSGGEVAA